MRSHWKRDDLKKPVIIIIWLIIWQGIALLVSNDILLSGPLEVVKSLYRLLWESTFYMTLLFSMLRILGGFLAGMILGVLGGILASFNKTIEDFFEPVILLLKSVPIAAFVVLLLIWSGSLYLSIWISLLVVIPNAYIHTVSGIKKTDKELKKLCNVFQIPKLVQMKYLYLPSVLPSIADCVKISVGMAFKSGVAAEVIGTPEYSFGERLYMSKIMLDTSGVLAWTLVILFLSILTEKIMLFLVNRLRNYPALYFVPKESGKLEKQKKTRTEDERRPGIIRIENLKKSYQDKEIFTDFSYQFKAGGVYILDAISGAGKTTLFRILLDLEAKDAGIIEGIEKNTVTVQFQEEVYFEERTAYENAFLFGMNGQSLKENTELFLKLLPLEVMNQKMNELSGGMRKRVGLIRAMSQPKALILLDEPLTGLDYEAKSRAIEFIMSQKGEATLLVATHDPQVIEGLKGEMIHGI